MDKLPPTIYKELVEGLILLDNLNLSFRPQTIDDLDKTTTAWEIALCVDRQWDEEVDAERLTQAFLSVAPKLDKFPTPKIVIEHLPKRPPPPALPQPETVECPPEIAAELGALFGQMIINQSNEDTKQRI